VLMVTVTAPYPSSLTTRPSGRGWEGWEGLSLLLQAGGQPRPLCACASSHGAGACERRCCRWAPCGVVRCVVPPPSDHGDGPMPLCLVACSHAREGCPRAAPMRSQGVGAWAQGAGPGHPQAALAGEREQAVQVLLSYTPASLPTCPGCVCICRVSCLGAVALAGELAANMCWCLLGDLHAG
jgi:hypothetical protein